MNRSLPGAAVVMLSCLLGCEPERQLLPTPTAPVAPAPEPALSSLQLEARVPWVITGQVLPLHATALSADGSPAPPSTRFTWTVNNEFAAGITSNQCGSFCDWAFLTARSTGQVTVTVSAGGKTASVTFTALVNAPPIPEVVVDSFSVEEITTPDGDGWFYLPSMRLRNTSTLAEVEVIGVKLTFPDGLGVYPVVLCAPTDGATTIMAGSSRNVFDLENTGRLDFSEAFGVWDGPMTRIGAGVVQAMVYLRTWFGDGASIGSVYVTGLIKPASAATVRSHKPDYETSKWLTWCS